MYYIEIGYLLYIWIEHRDIESNFIAFSISVLSHVTRKIQALTVKLVKFSNETTNQEIEMVQLYLHCH